jgi:sugar phosphate permease
MMKYLSDLNWWKQLALNVGGVLTAVLAFLGMLNIHYEWFTDSSINAAMAIIVAFGTLFVGSLATLLNTYLTKRAKEKATQVAVDYAQEQATNEDAERERIKAIVEQVLEAQNAATTPSKEKNTATTDTPSK